MPLPFVSIKIKKDHISFVEWCACLTGALRAHQRKLEPKITYSFQQKAPLTTTTSSLSSPKINNNSMAAANVHALFSKKENATMATTTHTATSSRSFSNMDDFIHRLKEKNSNLINILNNHSSNNNISATNDPHSKIGKQQKENDSKPSATTTAAGIGSGNYIKAILNKHKAVMHSSNSTAKHEEAAATTNNQNQNQNQNETASSLVVAALNLTNTARFTTNMHHPHPNSHHHQQQQQQKLLLPNIPLKETTTATVTTVGGAAGHTSTSSHIKSLVSSNKYSSSTLFKLNNLKSHFQFNKNF
jgi:hypothetical protein